MESYIALINGRKSMGNVGEIILLIGVITPFMPGRPTLNGTFNCFPNIQSMQLLSKTHRSHPLKLVA